MAQYGRAGCLAGGTRPCGRLASPHAGGGATRRPPALPDHARRYLRSHAALRAILREFTTVPLDFAVAEHGKPYLPAIPDLQFNLSHSHERALIAVGREIPIGADIEWLRPLPEHLAIAERFFPPAEFAALAETQLQGREDEFFRRWTRIEAVLKARGVGLYGAGIEPEGEWSVLPVEAGEGYVASIAAGCAAIQLRPRHF